MSRCRELRIAREVAEIDLVDTALRILADVLLHEHVSLDLAEDDPPSLLAARRVVAAARLLRAELRRYRRIVLAPPRADHDQLPF